MPCKICKYWLYFSNDISNGECHRYPPLPIKTPSMHPQIDAYFPVTSERNWCGEFKVKEKK